MDLRFGKGDIYEDWNVIGFGKWVPGIQDWAWSQCSR